jgi:hypothetical protein
VFIIYIYWMVSLVVIITSFNIAGWSAGLSAFGTSLLSFIAGGGLRGSLHGNTGQKLTGGFIALVLMV